MKLTGRVCCFIVGAEKLKDDGTAFAQTALKEELRRLIIEENIRHFLCGMTPGELTAAAAVLELKAQYPAITLDCVLPYEKQAARWKEALREVYFNILADCDSTVTMQTYYDRKCIAAHRKYILANAQHALFLGGGRSTALMEKHLAKLGIAYNRIPMREMKKEAVS